MIRQGKKADIQHIIAINTSSLPEHYSEYFYEDMLRETPQAFLVAAERDKIIGYIMCRVEYGFSNLKRFNMMRKGHVVSIAVEERYRCKGIGRLLIDGGVKGLAEKKCEEVYLEVRISNSGAIRLYERLGFKISSTIDHYYRDGEAAHVMASGMN